MRGTCPVILYMLKLTGRRDLCAFKPFFRVSIVRIHVVTIKKFSRGVRAPGMCF